MQDREIVELYLKREEQALEKTAEKYKNYCVSIAERILGNREDAEEIWNDVLSAAWNLIPPNEPEHLIYTLEKSQETPLLKNLNPKRQKSVTAELKFSLTNLRNVFRLRFLKNRRI